MNVTTVNASDARTADMRLTRLRGAIPFGSGLLFALGLGISGMTQPAKVIGFLDVAGAWDPSLAFVMGGAVGTYLLFLQLARRRRAPLGQRVGASDDAVDRSRAAFAESPGARGQGTLSNGRLVGGAALFGAGWGMVGLCPGPAIVAAVTALPGVLVFVAAMIAGMLAWRFLPVWWQRLRGIPAGLAPASTAAQECGTA